MSCVCVFTPVVSSDWNDFRITALAAAASLGYTTFDKYVSILDKRDAAEENKISLDIEQSEIVTGQLHRDQTISVTRDGVMITFSRDARGKASLCVEGQGHSEDTLRAMGEELSKGVVQQYVYQRLIEEMGKRDFHIVEEQHNEDRSIRLKVRRWDN